MGQVHRYNVNERSRGKAASSPANGMAIPQIVWAEVPVWAEIARMPDAQKAWATKEATTPPIIIENLSEEAYLAAETRWLGPRAREAAKLQNAFAAFLKQQRTEFKDDLDREQFLRALWLNPGLHPASSTVLPKIGAHRHGWDDCAAHPYPPERRGAGALRDPGGARAPCWCG